MVPAALIDEDVVAITGTVTSEGSPVCGGADEAVITVLDAGINAARFCDA